MIAIASLSLHIRGMHPLDPYQAAKLLLHHHGREAKAYAMQRVVAMTEAGDKAGHAAWVRVFGALLELLATSKPNGHTLH